MTAADPLAKASLDHAILAALARIPDKTLSPTELAQTIGAGGDWHALLAPIRRAAIELALAGRLILYRKGKPADPRELRGVYRIGLPRQD